MSTIADAFLTDRRSWAEAVWASLPPVTTKQPQGLEGAAGRRLQGHLVTTAPETLLEDFARDVLGAVRLNDKYRHALRVVLGNQAEAERQGYALEQNIGMAFASPRTMRTINGQMQAAGITVGLRVGRGCGRVQTVQRFTSSDGPPPSPDLDTTLRWFEERGERRGLVPQPAKVPASLQTDDVPY